MARVTVYGADWCPKTKRTLAHLKERGIDFAYIDIDKDEKAAQWVAEHAGGKEKKPTLDVEGEVLVTPSNGQLDQALAAKGIGS